jgi:septation ring formation regulator EzrA
MESGKMPDPNLKAVKDKITAVKEQLEVLLHDEWDKPDELRWMIRELNTALRLLESSGD